MFLLQWVIGQSKGSITEQYKEGGHTYTHIHIQGNVIKLDKLILISHHKSIQSNPKC